MKTAMLYKTSDQGLQPVRTHNLVSTDPKEVVAHLRKGGLTLGHSVGFAVNHETCEVVELFKKGHPCQRDVKPLIAKGFTEWLFSYAFSCETFVLPNGKQVKRTKKAAKSK